MLAKEIAALRGELDARKKSAQKDFDSWLNQANSDQVASSVPTENLRLHARLNEGQGKTTQLSIDGKSRPVTLPIGYDWISTKDAPKAFTIQATGEAIAIPDAGDFEKNQGFSIGGWVKTSRRGTIGAIAARMEGPSAFHRGWDLWIEQDRVGMHIIHKWPEDALKVTTKALLQPNQWYHVMVSYDGSGKAAGVKVYLNGAGQPVDVFTDKLTQTIKTKAPVHDRPAPRQRSAQGCGGSRSSPLWPDAPRAGCRADC